MLAANDYNLVVFASYSYRYALLFQGRQKGGAGGSLSQGLWVQGPYEVTPEFSFIASLDVFKEPPNRSSLQGSTIAP